MRYNIQNVIKRLQDFQKQNPDIELVDEDRLLEISTKKIYNLDQIVKRLKHAINGLDIAFEDFKNEKKIRNRQHLNYDEMNEAAGEIYKKYKIPNKYPYWHHIDEDIRTNGNYKFFIRNISETAKLIIIARKTLHEWINEGIINDCVNGLNDRDREINLKNLYHTLRLISERSRR